MQQDGLVVSDQHAEDTILHEPVGVNDGDSSGIGDGQNNDVQVQPQTTVRRSSRQVVLPTRFNDFVLSSTNRQSDLDEGLLLVNEAALLKFQDAVKSEEWREAMNEEINAIERNCTWRLVDLPAGVKPIGLKWLYKVKKDAAGTRHSMVWILMMCLHQ